MSNMRYRATLLAFVAFVFLFVVSCFAWHGSAHRQITRAAVLSLPAAMQQAWNGEKQMIIEDYCMLPDKFRTYDESYKLDQLPVFCKKPDGKRIHDVTWNRADDLASIEYLMNGIIAGMREGNIVSAAKYAGVLAHFLEDSTCPAHALKPMDGPLDIPHDLLPPPPDKKDIYLHRVIEVSVPEFDLGRRAPRSAGRTVSEAAVQLLDRTYQTVKENRANLLELVRAVYRDDEAKVNQCRLKTGQAGAELLADALYTALLLSSHSGASRSTGLTVGEKSVLK